MQTTTALMSTYAHPFLDLSLPIQLYYTALVSKPAYVELTVALNTLLAVLITTSTMFCEVASLDAKVCESNAPSAPSHHFSKNLIILSLKISCVILKLHFARTLYIAVATLNC